MRKLNWLVLVAMALVASAAPLSAQAAPKWGYINSQRIIAEAPGSREAQQELERDLQRYQAELEQLETEIEQMIEQYQQQQSMLSAEARQQREQAIGQKQQEYQQRAMQLEQQASQRQQELVEPIMSRIRTVIDAMREEGGYAFIFDVASGAVIAADTTLDLTDEVLSRLRSMASNSSGR